MATSIIGPKFIARDASGNPLALGKVFTYEPGTSTLKATYNDEDKTGANANPVILDANGTANIYLDGIYKVVVKDANDVEIYTVDPVTDASQLAQEWIHERTATQASSSSFTMTGNQTNQYSSLRRIKLVDASTLYGTVVSSSYSGGITTVIADVDNGDAITASLTKVYASILDGKNNNIIGIKTIDTVADLFGLEPDGTYDVIYNKGQLDKTDGIKGHWDWNDATDKTTANYIDIMDPLVNIDLSSQGSGSGLGCWHRNYEEYVDVVWAGTKGDAVTAQETNLNRVISGTDDSGAIQASINLAVLRNKSCKLRSNHRIDTPLYVPYNINFVFETSAIEIHKNTLIAGADMTSILQIAKNDGATSRASYHATINRIGFFGNGYALDDVTILEEASDIGFVTVALEFNNCRFSTAKRAGVAIGAIGSLLDFSDSGTEATATGDGIKFNRCEFGGIYSVFMNVENIYGTEFNNCIWSNVYGADATTAIVNQVWIKYSHSVVFNMPRFAHGASSFTDGEFCIRIDKASPVVINTPYFEHYNCIKMDNSFFNEGLTLNDMVINTDEDDNLVRKVAINIGAQIPTNFNNVSLDSAGSTQNPIARDIYIQSNLFARILSTSGNVVNYKNIKLDIGVVENLAPNSHFAAWNENKGAPMGIVDAGGSTIARVDNADVNRIGGQNAVEVTLNATPHTLTRGINYQPYIDTSRVSSTYAVITFLAIVSNVNDGETPEIHVNTVVPAVEKLFAKKIISATNDNTFVIGLEYTVNATELSNGYIQAVRVGLDKDAVSQTFNVLSIACIPFTVSEREYVPYALSMSRSNLGYMPQTAHNLTNKGGYMAGDVPVYYSHNNATPTVGDYEIGDIYYNAIQAKGSNLGYICTTAGEFGVGSPVFNEFGAIADSTLPYTPTNVVSDRAFDADATSTSELADVLGTLINDLKDRGVIG